MNPCDISAAKGNDMCAAQLARAAKLLPCPHCGETEHLYLAYHGLAEGKPYAIDCLGCGSDFTPREGMDVVAAWNRREPVADTDALGLLADIEARLIEVRDALDCFDQVPFASIGKTLDQMYLANRRAIDRANELQRLLPLAPQVDAANRKLVTA